MHVNVKSLIMYGGLWLILLFSNDITMVQCKCSSNTDQILEALLFWTRLHSHNTRYIQAFHILTISKVANECGRKKVEKLATWNMANWCWMLVHICSVALLPHFAKSKNRKCEKTSMAQNA